MERFESPNNPVPNESSVSNSESELRQPTPSLGAPHDTISSGFRRTTSDASNSPSRTQDQTYTGNNCNLNKLKSKMEPQVSHVKIYRPYDIEEPDDETDGTGTQGLEMPCLPDYFERWQRDLVDDIDGTESDPSEYTTGQWFPDLARGQKRKPTGSAGIEYHSTSQRHFSRPGIRPRDETMSAQCHSAPKRRRRRSRVTSNSAKTAPAQSLYDFRDTQLNESSSSDYWSTDGSADSMQDSAITDDMDID